MLRQVRQFLELNGEGRHLVGEKTKGETRLLDRQRLPGMGAVKAPCYHILPSIFSAEI